MKKFLLVLVVSIMASGCELDSVLGSGSKLVGTWVHQGITGSVIYDKVTYSLNDNSAKGEVLELMKGGKMSYDGFDKYTIDGNIVTFINSSSGDEVDLRFDILGDELTLYQNTVLYKRNDTDPKVTYWDFNSTFTKQ